jgi:hypothetical protein
VGTRVLGQTTIDRTVSADVAETVDSIEQHVASAK